MGGGVEVHDEQNKSHHQEDQAEPIDRQHSHAIGGQGQANHADKTGHPAPGSGDLDQHRHHPQLQQDKDDARVGQDGQQLLDQGIVYRFQLGPGQVEAGLSQQGLDRAAIRLAQQIGHVDGDDVDQPDIQGFLGGYGAGVFDRVFGQLDRLRPARPGQRAHGSFEDILGLGFDGLAQVLALRADRAGGADGGLRGHGGQVAGQGDDSTGATGHGAARGHIDDHRDPAGADGLDHVGHQFDAAAGCIQLKDNRCRRLGLSLPQPAREILFHRRVESATGGQHHHPRRLILGGDRQHSQPTGCQQVG